MNLWRRLAWLALPLLLPSLAWANPDCAKVDATSILGAYMKAHAEHFPVSPDEPDSQVVADMVGAAPIQVEKTPSGLRWIGIGLESPIGGVIVVVDCAGKTLDAVEPGELESMRPGPVLPQVGETMLVSATDAEGTGGRHKTISLFAIKQGRLTALWRHTLYEAAYFPGSEGDEVEFQVSLPDANSIEVTGERRLYRVEGEDWSKSPYKVQKLHEMYCWDGARSGYGICTQAPGATKP